MSKTAFPVNDLFRRKAQTSLIVVTLTLSVASTLFLLLFSQRLGLGISSASGTLTLGLSAVFGQFVLFVAILIFAVGAVITSFIVFLMMKQRTRDFGLIKAAGCPNGLVFGYFITELLAVTLIGCILGMMLGFVADFAVVNTFRFQVYQTPPNFWLAPAVFAFFFILSVTFGTKPMLDAARTSPAKLMSPAQYYGLSKGGKLKPLSRFGLTLRLASRSLFRRQSASVRIIVLLSVVFVLLTVSIAGGIIANDTTESWVEKAVGRNVIVIAHSSMGEQYTLLLSKFFGTRENSSFNYTDEKFAVPNVVLQELNATPGILKVDPRLVLMEPVREQSGYTIDPDTLSTIPVGDNRTGAVLMVGVDPEKIVAESVMEGQFLNSSSQWTAVVGDTVVHEMYSSDRSKKISVSNPLLEGMIVRDNVFKITGACIDPLNNGNVTYVPLMNLQNVTGIFSVNVVLVKLDPSVDRATILTSLKAKVEAVNPGLSVFDLDEVLEKNLAFLGSTWSAIMLLPVFALVSASLCLVGYMMLSSEEQRPEFAILRALGTKPNTTIAVLSIQSVIVLLSSFGVGISFGVITTLLILMPNPVVTAITIVKIAALLFAALAGMFVLSLFPALRMAKASILKMMT
jgi:ABC-type antimicrobial peptide transport system permease subunit